jgi:DNA helicase-2/ATP-dependent DNA helicase PcrA
MLATAQNIRFDESYPGYHMYDHDICRQAIEAGWSIFCLPNGSDLIFHNTKASSEVNELKHCNECVEIYKNKFQPFGYEDRDNQIDYYRAGVDLLTNYFDKYNDLKIKPVVIEKMFKFDLNGVPVSGKIDRIDLNEDGTYEIIDYKTGELKTEKDIRNDDQLTLYAQAAKEFFNYTNVKLTYFYIEHDKKISTERSAEDFSRLGTEVQEVFTNIRNKNFTAKPSQRNCMFCDFKDICPSAIKD